ncbi:hypothetical protein LVJ94_49325 [Pendulispora rubella]|uniref:Alpha-L-rhamnosidase n=1 Tax=Pendulispora rubella TaxID=2741070 RepID=A0ABZ2L1R8_9BACT
MLDRVSLTALLVTSGVVAAACSSSSSSNHDDTNTDGASIDLSSFDSATFTNPPRRFHPYVRWWWPGGAVETEQLQHDIDALYEAGYGGVEVQPFSANFDAAFLESHPEILSVGRPAFWSHVNDASIAARAKGLAFDMTLGSAWPIGGPFIAPEHRLRELTLSPSASTLCGPLDYDGPIPAPAKPQHDFPVEFLKEDPSPLPEKLIAVTAARVQGTNGANIPVLDAFRDLTAGVHDGQVRFKVPNGCWTVFGVYERIVGQYATGGAYPSGKGYVADHLGHTGIAQFLSAYADPMVASLGGGRPQAVFEDSLELLADLPWGEDFAANFRRSAGYDPTPFYPLMFRAGGECEGRKIFSPGPMLPRFASAGPESRVREDYERARSEAFVKEHIEPIQSWAKAHGIAFREQAHGGWVDYLDGYSSVDIPETEGLFSGGSYNFLKLASSAASTSGRAVVTAEAFPAIVPDAYALKPDDLRLLAGRMHSAGVNRIIEHGHPYPLETGPGTTWYPFQGQGFVACCRFDATHPNWPELAQLNRTFARTQYALSLGQHRPDVAWLHADQEERIASAPNKLFAPESDASLSLRKAGYVYDRVSPNGLAGAVVKKDRFQIGRAEFRALVLDDLPAASPEVLRAVVRIAEAGIPVITQGNLPSRAFGLASADSRDAEVRGLSERIRAHARTATSAQVGTTVRTADVVPIAEAVDGQVSAFLEHRSLRNAELLFVFNDSDATLAEDLRVGVGYRAVRTFDPDSGRLTATSSPTPGAPVHLEVPSRRGLFLLLDSR